MDGIKNEAGIFNARLCTVCGNKGFIATHRDPTTGRIWCEGYGNNPNIGDWIRPEFVRFLD